MKNSIEFISLCTAFSFPASSPRRSQHGRISFQSVLPLLVLSNSCEKVGFVPCTSRMSRALIKPTSVINCCVSLICINSRSFPNMITSEWAHSVNGKCRNRMVESLFPIIALLASCSQIVLFFLLFFSASFLDSRCPAWCSIAGVLGDVKFSLAVFAIGPEGTFSCQQATSGDTPKRKFILVNLPF